jgi:hypothetical protein
MCKHLILKVLTCNSYSLKHDDDEVVVFDLTALLNLSVTVAYLNEMRLCEGGGGLLI